VRTPAHTLPSLASVGCGVLQVKGALVLKTATAGHYFGGPAYVSSAIQGYTLCDFEVRNQPVDSINKTYAD
jgi:hypothetical protein